MPDVQNSSLKNWRKKLYSSGPCRDKTLIAKQGQTFEEFYMCNL